jgi:hypothetical protein
MIVKTSNVQNLPSPSTRLFDLEVDNAIIDGR